MTTSDTSPSVARARLQRRTVRVLVASQILGGVGVGSGIAVVALLAYDLAGTESLAGLAPTATTIGAALAAMLIARIAISTGRRRGLVIGYLIGATGAIIAVVAAVAGSYPLHIVASVAFGSASAANLQARYAATDLADDDRRAGALSTIVWATTIGAVLGPNLTGPGASVAAVLGFPALAGPYVFSFASFGAAALVQWIWLRPDPLQMARALASPSADTETGPPTVVGSTTVRKGAMRTAIRSIRAVPAAFAAFVAIGAAHATMVAVMVMTPVHMEHHGATLQLVGLTISLHIAGMYALSPVFGKLADWLGRPAVIVGGCTQLAAASLLAAMAEPMGQPAFQLALVLLGTGWSCCLVAGSAMLTDALAPHERPAAQGASDLVMNLSGAAGGTLAGIVLAVASYEALAFGSLALIVAPLWLTTRPAVWRDGRVRQDRVSDR